MGDCRRCAWATCSYRAAGDFAGCEAAGAFIFRQYRPAEHGPPMYPGLDERESLDEFYGDTFWSESGFLGYEVGDQ